MSFLKISTEEGACLRRNMNDEGLYTTASGANMMTNEGIAAVNEAITFLKNQAPINTTITFSQELWNACRDIGEDQATSGATGHTGSDGSSPFTRMERYATITYPAGENLAYGSSDAKDAIIQLIIDDGVSNRGHRTNIFKPDWRVMGNYWGTHSQYRQLYCQAFAAGATPLA